METRRRIISSTWEPRALKETLRGRKCPFTTTDSWEFGTTWSHVQNRHRRLWYTSLPFQLGTLNITGISMLLSIERRQVFTAATTGHVEVTWKKETDPFRLAFDTGCSHTAGIEREGKREREREGARERERERNGALWSLGSSVLASGRELSRGQPIGEGEKSGTDVQVGSSRPIAKLRNDISLYFGC